MKKARPFVMGAAGAIIAGIFITSIGCEQAIGLDGPYIAAKGSSGSGGGGGGGTVGECTDGMAEACYSGDPALKGIGACQPGMRTCANGAWGACTGEGSPSIEACAGNDDDCDGNSMCTGAVDWALSFGGLGADSSAAIATDATGNIVVAGSFDKPAAFGGAMITPVGGSDVILFKLDAAGKPIWSKAFGSSGTDNSRGLAVDANGNILLVGVMAAAIDFGGGPLPQNKVTMFAVKFDADGKHIWSTSFTGASSIGTTDAAVDASGNLIISTTITGSIDFGSGLQTAQNESMAIVKLDSSGKNVFSKLFGSSKTVGTLRTAIATDAQGNIGVGGSILGTMVLGSTNIMSTQRDVFLAKLNPMGEVSWAAHGIASGDASVEGIAADHTGAWIISGTFATPTLKFGTDTITGSTNTDGYVAKFDANGVYGWGKSFGAGGSTENGSEVAVDDANNIVFAGNTNSNALDLGMGVMGPAGMFVVKLDPTGKSIWTRISDGATTPYPDACIAVDKQGHPFLSRGFAAPMTFGGMTLTGYGSTDIFVMKLGL